MSDHVCRYCQDEGGSCCSTWCPVCERWVFVFCSDHMQVAAPGVVVVKQPQRRSS